MYLSEPIITLYSPELSLLLKSQVGINGRRDQKYRSVFLVCRFSALTVSLPHGAWGEMGQEA